MTQLKDIARRHKLSFRPNSSFLSCQKQLKAHLQGLIKDTKGSAASATPLHTASLPRELGSQMEGRRLSYSQAATPGKPRLTVLGRVRKVKVAPVPKVALQQRTLVSLMKPSQPVSTVAMQEGGALSPSDARSPSRSTPQPVAGASQSGPSLWFSSPLYEEGELPAKQPAKQPAKARGAKAQQPAKAAPAAPSAASNSQDQRLAHLEQRVASLEQEKQQQLAELASLRAQVGRLEQQLRQCNTTALSATQSAASLQGVVDRLQDQSAHHEKLHEEVGILRSKQHRLSEQQELEECQRSVVLKARAGLAMPAGEPVAVEGWLMQRFGEAARAVTVLRVHQLQRREGTGGSTKTTTYKVVLGNGKQRDTVLRAKAAALRGTEYTIDVCLTRQQLASKHALMPVARQAQQVGRRVQWRYDKLYIDGKQHMGSSTLPPPRAQQQEAPRAQQQEASQPASSAAPATSAPALASDSKNGVWQKVTSRKQRRQPKQQKPAASGSQEGTSSAAAQGSKGPRTYASVAGKEDSNTAAQNGRAEAKVPSRAAFGPISGPERAQGSGSQQSGQPQQRPLTASTSPTRA